MILAKYYTFPRSIILFQGEKCRKFQKRNAVTPQHPLTPDWLKNMFRQKKLTEIVQKSFQKHLLKKTVAFCGKSQLKFALKALLLAHPSLASPHPFATQYYTVYTRFWTKPINFRKFLKFPKICEKCLKNRPIFFWND